MLYTCIHTLWVDIKGLLSGDRVCANDGVLIGYRVSANPTSTRQGALGLLVSGVDGPQTVQTLAELGRQTLVGLGHVDEEGVTTCRGTVQQVQERGAGGLLLVGDIRVPGHGVGVLRQERRAAPVVGAAVNQMHLWETLGGAGGWVDVVTTEVAAEFEGFLDGDAGKVLVAECCISSEKIFCLYGRRAHCNDVPTIFRCATSNAN